MAKSKIIKELANNEISLDVALNRLLIIASDIENEELANWAQNELDGYASTANLPAYRQIQNVRYVYSGINGSYKVDNAPLPFLEIMGFDKNEYPFKIVDSVNALSTLTSEKYQYGRDLTAMAGAILEKTGIYCTSIRQLVPHNAIENLLSSIKSKLLRVLIKLDKEYGCLDNLDIDISQKKPEEVQKINSTVINYIFEDRSIKIGDKNRIEGTEIKNGENNE